MASIVKNGLSRLLVLGNSRKPGIICLLLTAGMLIAGLWPFNFLPQNKVEWITNERGVHFHRPGIMYSRKPLIIQEDFSRSAVCRIDLLLRAKQGRGYMTILSLYDPDREQFMVGQYKKELYIRVPRRAATFDDQKRYREIGIENVIEEDTTHLITIVSKKESTDMYVDGRRRKSFANFTLLPDGQGFSGHLVLGNSPEGSQAWDGALFGLAIYDGTLSDREVFDHYQAWKKQDQLFLAEKGKATALYLFDERSGEVIQDRSGMGNDLLAPAIFQPLHRTFLDLPARGQWFTRSNLMDIAINIVGFIPFGFILAAWLGQTRDFSSSRVFWTVLALGFGLSLAIELTQAYLPTRDSSLLDLIDNCLGTAAGVMLFMTIRIK